MALCNLCPQAFISNTICRDEVQRSRSYPPMKKKIVAKGSTRRSQCPKIAKFLQLILTKLSKIQHMSYRRTCDYTLKKTMSIFWKKWRLKTPNLGSLRPQMADELANCWPIVSRAFHSMDFCSVTDRNIRWSLLSHHGLEACYNLFS